MKKVLNILPEFILLLFLSITVSLVHGEQYDLKFDKTNIKIANNDEYIFIDEQDVLNIINSQYRRINTMRVDSINTLEIEQAINTHQSVKSSQVYYDITGVLHVRVKQRVPIIRVISSTGDGFYIDEDGAVMPLSSKYNARVVIANGQIDASYQKQLNVSEVDSLSDDLKILNKLYTLARFINKDDFWSTLIEQIYVNEKKEFILTPKIGPKQIDFGGIDGYEYKMGKVKIFYDKGFKQKGFDKYSELNVMYSNQVIAKKIHYQ